MLQECNASGSHRLWFWLLFSCLWIAAPPPVKADDDDFTWNTWTHNGSTVYLEWKGSERSIYYLKPRSGLISRGVSEGTLLFTGRRTNFEYEGTAYIFSLCGPIGYEVKGTLSSELDHIRLEGKAPVTDGNCKVTSYRDDVLEFDTTDDDGCGCQCPGEMPVADVDTFQSSGEGTSCPYLYAWSERGKSWQNYGKVIHTAQGKHHDTLQKIELTEPAFKFRLAENEPENAFIDFVQLRIETEDNAIYVLQPSVKRLAARDSVYAMIPAFKAMDVRFTLPEWLDASSIRRSVLSVAGYYERLGSPVPGQCLNKPVRVAKLVRPMTVSEGAFDGN